MGQKVNPIGIRLKINRTWDSVWFAKKQNYGTYLIEDFKIRKYINNTIKNYGVSKILIERPSKQCVVTIYTSRPGFVIGKKGSDIEKIKNNISKIKNGNLIFFVDEKYNLSSIKKYFTKSENLFVNDLLKNQNLSKKIVSFDISSKKKNFFDRCKKGYQFFSD